MKKWRIDRSHSKISFSVKHLELVDVWGSFLNYEGQITQKHPSTFLESTFEFKGWPSSIFTGNPDRDEHLGMEDFFDTHKYECLEFKGTHVSQIDQGHYFIEGILKVKNNARPITITAAYKGKRTGVDSKDRIGFELTGLINRADFGLEWQGVDDEGVKLVSEQVQIHIQLQLLENTN